MVSAPRSARKDGSAWSRGKRFRLAGFVILVPAVGSVIGVLNTPGEWYAALNKPSFNPPNWVFAPVWTVLFLMIGVAGFRTFESRPRDMVAKLWIVQMVLNFAWSPIFFSLHRVDVALAVIISLFATIITFILRQWSADRLAAGLFIPYAAWVCFATNLNGALFILN